MHTADWYEIFPANKSIVFDKYNIIFQHLKSYLH